MAEPVTLQTLLTYLTLISVPIGVFYHIMTLRNTRKNQQLTLETRRMQIIMDLDQELKSTENYRKIIELLNMQWEGYDDFERKYGSDNNPENFAIRNSLFYRLNSIGILVKDGFVDAETVYDLMGEASTIWIWKKFEPVIKEMRRRYHLANTLKDFEFLYNELMKVRERKGDDVPILETFSEYIPDQ